MLHLVASQSSWPWAFGDGFREALVLAQPLSQIRPDGRALSHDSLSAASPEEVGDLLTILLSLGSQGSVRLVYILLALQTQYCSSLLDWVPLREGI